MHGYFIIAEYCNITYNGKKKSMQLNEVVKYVCMQDLAEARQHGRTIVSSFFFHMQL